MIIGEIKYDNVDFGLTPAGIICGIMDGTETPLNAGEISEMDVR